MIKQAKEYYSGKFTIVFHLIFMPHQKKGGIHDIRSFMDASG
jgi:hypothetical protein